MKFHWLMNGLVCLCLCAIDSASAQEPSEAEADIEPDRELVEQRSPAGSMRSFMHSAEQGDFESAARYLDLRYLPDSMGEPDGAALAEQLYIIISRQIDIDLDALSDSPDGADNDGLPTYRDLLGTVVTTAGQRAIYMQHVPGEGNERIWKVSNASVARIPELYAEHGYSPVVEWIREFSPEGSLAGIEYFKWMIGLTSAILAALAWLLFAGILSRLITRENPQNQVRVRRYLARPVTALIFIFVGSTAMQSLGLGATAQRVSEAGTIRIIIAVWFLFATVNLFRDLYAQYLSARHREAGLMLLGPITSTVKVLIAIFAVVIWLDNVGVNVTALIAGLGVGGLAVALVLQKPLEDIMGAITLYTQQPVRVGQFCTSGNVTGTIEEINLRTTRVRRPNNNVVLIPNALFANATIENITEKKRSLHRQTVRLSLDTSQEQLEQVIERLKQMVSSYPEVVEDAWRVRFFELGEFSINIDVFAHINTTDFAVFLEHSEAINLATIGILGEVGVSLAKPPR